MRVVAVARGAGWWLVTSGLALLLGLGLVARRPALADEALWARLREGGHVVMIRHATAPGTGDPPGFRIDDCATQRNLDEAGRDEARRIGAAFRARGVPVGRVLSSRWCRCLETARLAFGRAEPWPALDSYFEAPERDAQLTPVVRPLIGRHAERDTLVLVTHNVNIRAVTGIAPASGEMVVLTPRSDASFKVAGRIPVPALSRP